MGKLIDLVGQRFGRLTVIKRSENPSGVVAWLCECDCGKTKTIRGSDLRSGATKSCGCLHSEELIKRNSKHEKSGTRIYKTWGNMLSRCLNEKASCYNAYGGRGIKVCDAWRESFKTFYEWAMASGYRDDLTIDRINPDGNYCPENCRWATQKEQGNNRTTNHYLEFNGEKRSISEWATVLGISAKNIEYRIRKGWSVEKALTEGRRK